MEGKKCTLILLILSFVMFSITAQYKSEVYRAYINNQKSSWKSVIDKMQQETNQSDESLLELINYQYGYIGWCLGNDEKKQAKSYLKLAQDNLANLEKRSYNPSYINAYKSAFYGFSIGLNKLKAPFTGPKSIDAAKHSMKEDASNPYGFIQYGNAQFYMPPIFGGSKSEALLYYHQAENIMLENPSNLQEDWNYLSLLVNIADAYTEMKEYDKAEEYFKQILEVEPNFNWVKNELYPDFIKKRNNE